MQAPAIELMEKDVIKVNNANGLPNKKLGYWITHESTDKAGTNDFA